MFGNVQLAVIFFINLDLIGQSCDVRNVNFDSPVAESFHQFVILQFSIFRFVCMADDDFIDAGLREFFRFDVVFLRSAEQVIKEGDIQFQHFNEFDDSAVGDIEFAVEIEGTRV